MLSRMRCGGRSSSMDDFDFVPAGESAAHVRRRTCLLVGSQRYTRLLYFLQIIRAHAARFTFRRLVRATTGWGRPPSPRRSPKPTTEATPPGLARHVQALVPNKAECRMHIMRPAGCAYRRAQVQTRGLRAAGWSRARRAQRAQPFQDRGVTVTTITTVGTFQSTGPDDAVEDAEAIAPREHRSSKCSMS